MQRSGGGSSRRDPGLSRRLGASRTRGPVRQEMPTDICCFQRETPRVAPLGARLTDCLLLCGFKRPLVLRALPAVAPLGPSAPQSPGLLTSLGFSPHFQCFPRLRSKQPQAASDKELWASLTGTGARAHHLSHVLSAGLYVHLSGSSKLPPGSLL